MFCPNQRAGSITVFQGQHIDTVEPRFYVMVTVPEKTACIKDVIFLKLVKLRSSSRVPFPVIKCMANLCRYDIF
jgi:hypothetical protein